MKVPRCTKCKYFHKTRAKTRTYDHGQGFSMVAPSLADSLGTYLGTYLCHRRWWHITTLKEIKECNVCEDFKFKTKNND